MLLLQQLHAGSEAGATAPDDKLAGLGEVYHGAARAPRIQLPRVKHQAAGGPQVLHRERGDGDI